MIFAGFSGGVPLVTSRVGSLAGAGEGNINVWATSGSCKSRKCRFRSWQSCHSRVECILYPGALCEEQGFVPILFERVSHALALSGEIPVDVAHPGAEHTRGDSAVSDSQSTACVQRPLEAPWSFRTWGALWVHVIYLFFKKIRLWFLFAQIARKLRLKAPGA
jgi:hypothetical protein